MALGSDGSDVQGSSFFSTLLGLASSEDSFEAGVEGISFTESGDSVGLNATGVSLSDKQLSTVGFNDALDRWGVLSNEEWNTLSDDSRQTLYNGYRTYLNSKSNNDTDLWRLQNFVKGKVVEVRKAQDLSRERSEIKTREGLRGSVFAGSAVKNRQAQVAAVVASPAASLTEKRVAPRAPSDDVFKSIPTGTRGQTGRTNRPPRPSVDTAPRPNNVFGAT